MLVSGIDAETYRLLRFAGSDRQLNSEWRTPHYNSLLLFEQNARLSRRTRHQRLPSFV